VNQALVRTGVVAGTLVFLAFAGHAAAGLPTLPNSANPLVIPVIDEETAIEELERPNEVPPGSQEGNAPAKTAPMEDDADNGADPEVRELQRAFPSTEWPPSMREKE
jgi:hypothetical protein